MTARPKASAAAVIGAAAGLLLWSAPPASAYPRPGAIERIAIAADGGSANGASFSGGVSDDGRFVAFSSHASNLVPGDTNEAEDVFVHDWGTGETEMVSLSSDGTQGDNTSTWAVISGDGRLVAFYSAATNLVPNDSNFENDVFVHDRQTGETERVSVSSIGAQGNERSFDPDISADGRYVVFESAAENLVPNDTNGACAAPAEGCDIFVHDRQTAETTRVSVDEDGTQADGPSGGAPRITADGRYVVFSSFAPNLIPGDTNNTTDVFVKDLWSGTVERVSVSSDEAQGNAGSTQGVISDDGRYVAFHSAAGTLVPADGNRAGDIFVRDRMLGTTERVSVSSSGTEGTGTGIAPAGAARVDGISADGRYVSFTSNQVNLVPGDSNGVRDVFVRDRVTGTTERISVAADGTEGDGETGADASLTPDGRFVHFSSRADNLVPGDTGVTDPFLRDRGPTVGVGELDAVTESGTVSASGWATFSGSLLTSNGDPPSDGTAGAGTLGGELTGASVTYRVEDESLLIRLGVTSLPSMAGSGSAPGVAGAPGVVYGLKLTVAGTAYEVRALRASATVAPPAAPLFAVYRCAPTCSEVARRSGGIGTTGREILVSVPISDLEIGAGSQVTDVRAYTAAGEASVGPLDQLDAVDLEAFSLPAATVALGITPAGTPHGDVVFSQTATLNAGRFSGTLDAPSPSGPHDLWAEACLGIVCGTETVRVQ